MCIYYHKYSGQWGKSPPLEPLSRERGDMARPKKSPGDLHDVRTTVLLTEQERAELEQRAQLAGGLTLSEFIRRRALGIPLPAGAAEQRTRAALATALLRLGVNLNQIARHMNAGRAAPSYLPALIEDIRRHVERLVDDEPGRDRQR